MAHSQTHDAIVLKTYDVGEADRFCILLTQARGRLAARARAVRKLQSKMGAGLLALRRATVELHEGQSGFLITTVHSSTSFQSIDVATYVAQQQAMELLLMLLQDEEAVPEIFASTCDFLAACRRHPAPLLPFVVRLLKLFGILPDPREQAEQWGVSLEGTNFLSLCTTQQWTTAASPPSQDVKRMQKHCEMLVQAHLVRPVRIMWAPAAATNPALQSPALQPGSRAP